MSLLQSLPASSATLRAPSPLDPVSLCRVAAVSGSSCCVVARFGRGPTVGTCLSCRLHPTRAAKHTSLHRRTASRFGVLMSCYHQTQGKSRYWDLPATPPGPCAHREACATVGPCPCAFERRAGMLPPPSWLKWHLQLRGLLELIKNLVLYFKLLPCYKYTLCPKYIPKLSNSSKRGKR